MWRGDSAHAGARPPARTGGRLRPAARHRPPAPAPAVLSKARSRAGPRAGGVGAGRSPLLVYRSCRFSRALASLAVSAPLRQRQHGSRQRLLRRKERASELDKLDPGLGLGQDRAGGATLKVSS